MECSVGGEFVEVETGKRNDWPELAKVIACAKRHKATLFLGNIDRVGRRVHFISGLMESGVKFLAVDAPDDEPFTLHVKASFAEEECRKISQRTKAALAVLKGRGVKLGTPENLTDEAKAKGASANRDKAVVAYALVSPLAQSWRTEGLSFGAIADRLNAKSIPTRTGTTWSAKQVKRLIDRGAHQAV